MDEMAKFAKPLSGGARDVLYQLVMNGPTWDGNITSKAGRGDLFDLGLAERVNGWSGSVLRGMALKRGPHRGRRKAPGVGGSTCGVLTFH